jgi:AcrR family transcriptional regulator
MSTDHAEQGQQQGAAPDTRERIIRAAAALLASHGRQGVTTRAVAAEAGVQAPAIYRLFIDMDGLLDAVAEQLLHDYVAKKSRRAVDPDPVQDLKDGWEQQIDFNLSHPEVFRMMVSNPGRSQSPAAVAGTKILQDKIGKVARAGRLKVSEERAENLIRVAGYGAVLIMLGQPEETCDLGLAVAAQEAVFATILKNAVAPGETAVISAAVTLKASLAEQDAWSAGEKGLLGEWLDRVINRR